jgi:transketolase
VLAPGDFEEARLATRAAAAMQGPVYIRLGRDRYPVVPELHAGFTIGKAKLLRAGTDLTVVTTGIMASEGLEAAMLAVERGLSVRVLHMPTVKPLDEDALLEAARETRGFVTAEEHSIVGGLGEAVAGFLAGTLPRPVRRVGVRDVFGESGAAGELLDRYHLRASDIFGELARLSG